MSLSNRSVEFMQPDQSADGGVILIKAEVVRLEGREPRDNPRFVITNLPWTPKNVYKFYAGRGDMENRIKQLHWGKWAAAMGGSGYADSPLQTVSRALINAHWPDCPLDAKHLRADKERALSGKERL